MHKAGGVLRGYYRGRAGGVSPQHSLTIYAVKYKIKNSVHELRKCCKTAKLFLIRVRNSSKNLEENE